MKILFNLHDVGLANNGGSRTLILCAEALKALGHEVRLYSNLRSRYTWHKTKIVQCERIESCDLMIATGYKSVRHVVKAKCPRKLYYIRGFELWQAEEKKLFESYRSLPCIVNSQWLHDYLQSKNVKSTIVYPGLDFSKFKNNRSTRSGIGGLYHERHKTKRHKDVAEIAKLSKEKLILINKDVKDCSSEKMSKVYNSIKVWVAPTELEGLHNPPMEASLCGCGLVCTDSKKSGMSDYAINNQTALVYPERDLNTAAQYVRKLIDDPILMETLNQNMVNLLRTKIGTRTDNMAKMVKLVL